MLVSAKDVQVGDILIQNKFFRDRVEEVKRTPMGLIRLTLVKVSKLTLNDDTATMFFTPNETLLVARPKTVVTF